MAALFPSYIDVLVEGFPMGFTEPSVPQNKFVPDSQNVAEYCEKLLNRLSILLFHFEKQINQVLLQGRYLPKKLSHWASKARSLKCQVSDLLLNQQNRKSEGLICEELVELGIELINHLKKCPFKDEYMYDKPTPVITLRHQSDLSKQPSRSQKNKSKQPSRTEQKYTSGKNLNSQDKKKADAQCKAEESLNPLRHEDVLQGKDDGMTLSSAGTSVPTVESQKINDVVTVAIRVGGEPISTSESMQGSENFTEESSEVHDDVILAVSPPNTDSASIPGDQSALQSTADIISACDIGPQQVVEAASYGEIQVVCEISTLSGAENVKSAEHKHIDDISNFVNSKHKTLDLSCPREIKGCYSDFVPDKEHYVVMMKDNFINLELDDRTIPIGDCPSSGQLESSSVNVLNLAEQDLRLLPEKPDYPNSFLLFLQRNNHLTQIHDSFFNTMPDLCFLDMSDTRIRILPKSLFNLSKLKVLMLRNCVCLENLPPEIGKLSLMEVLDLSGTELYSLPDEIGQLTLLSYMQLSFYGPDDESEYSHLPSELISPNLLSHFEALQSISIAVHPDDHRWRNIAACIIKDVGKLGMLRYLHVYFPEVKMFENFIQLSPSWKNRKLRKFKFVVGRDGKRIASRVPNEIESLFDKHGQCLRFVNGDEVPREIRSVLDHVKAFYLDHHITIRSFSDFWPSDFRSLKFCLVRECPNIRAILDGYIINDAFPCLEYLGVYYLWELEHIIKEPRFSGVFQALMYLTVSTCPKLQFILWESMLQCLSNLKELVVEDCESVEIIVKEEKEKVNCDGIMLPGLRKVVLQYLPMLVSLGNGLCLSDEKISIYGCPKLILNPHPREQTMVKQRKFLGSLRAALQFK